MAKILFLTNIPMIRQHRIDMYVDSIASCFETSLWDLSEIYGNKDRVRLTENEAIRISSIIEFDNKLREEKENGSVIIITNILLPNLKPVYTIIKQNKIPIVNINKDYFASWMYNMAAMRHRSLIGYKQSLKAALHHYSIPRHLLYWYHCRNIKYDYQLSSYNFFPEENKVFVKIHNVKYDETIRAEKQPSIIDGNYILFLDAALADHPMFANAKNRINRELYLKQLNSYFKLLEDKYGLSVVISAHPKSDYKESDFDGRMVIMYKTPVLINHAYYIISHYTTSLYDTILQNKPFKVLYSKELVRAACSNTVLAGIQVADCVNAENVCLDSPTLNEFNVDLKKYDSFKQKFLLNVEKTDYSNNELIIAFLNKIVKTEYENI